MTEVTRRAGRFAVLATALVTAAGFAAHAPSSRAASPPARGLELVSAAGSDAADVEPALLLPSGDGAIFHSLGGLLGAPDGIWNAFTATRGAGGWEDAWLTSATPVDIDTSASLGNGAHANLAIGASADGRRVFDRTVARLSAQDANRVSDLYVLEDGHATLLTHDESGNAVGLGGADVGSDVRSGIKTVATRQHDVAVMAPNANRAIVTTPGTNPLVASADPLAFGLYAIDADGTVHAIDGDVDADTAFRGTSDDGSVVAYVSGGKLHVWDGASSVVVADATAGDPSARVTADGSTVFVTTAQALDVSAPAGVTSVYAYDVASRTATLLSPASAARGAAFVTASRDGSRVFFVSTDALAAGARGGDQNLYVESGGVVALVADMGATVPAVRRIDATMDPTLPPTVAMLPDGSAALLLTEAQLDAGDTNGVPDAYLWTAAGGRLTLASASRTGRSPTGLSIDLGTEPISGFETGYGWYDANGDGPRVLSNDGRWAFFSSTAALTGDAGGDGAVKIYGWHDGTLSLISPPGDAGDAFLIGASATGRDVFFTTFDALLPTDSDGSHTDLYDARVGGGFPTTTPPESGCPPEGCAPLGPPVPPASAGFTGPGDPEPADGPSARIELARRIRAHGTRATVRVRVAGGGRLTLRGGRLVGDVARRVPSAGRVSLTVELTAQGRRLLAERRRLRATVRATFVVAGAPTRSRTVVITFIKQAPSRAEEGGKR